MIQKIIKDTFVTTVIKLFSAFLKFLIILYITNTFGAEEFGAYMFAMTVFLLVNLIFRFGFDLYVQREVSVFLEDNKQKEGFVLLLNTILDIVQNKTFKEAGQEAQVYHYLNDRRDVLA